MLKSTPITLANGTYLSNCTFTLSVAAPTIGQTMKRETVEATLVFAVTNFQGTTPTLTFNIDEYVDGNWIPVGQAGTFTGTGFAVVDSGGGQLSTGGTQFTASSNLRLLGKGIDTRVRAVLTGTVGTAQYTVDYIGYFGN